MKTIDLGYTTVKQPLPDFIYDGLVAFAKHSNDYHYQPDMLRKKIAAKYCVPLEYVFLIAGGSQAIMLLGLRYGQQTHIFTPSYISYGDISKLGGTLTEHDALVDGQYQLPAAPIPDATLFFVANPNNPIGITKRETILELARNNSHAKIAIDEAYGDFADESVIQDVVDYPNLLVIRSFSKSYALAGFRIAFMIAHPTIIEDLAFGSTWANVAYTSVGAAVTAMDHEEYFTKMRQGLIHERQITEDHLRKRGYTVAPSYLNAVLISFANESKATAFVQKLLAAGIVVNLGNGNSNRGLDNSYVRVAIGTPEQMRIFRDRV